MDTIGDVCHPEYSIVIPIYNEEQALPELHSRVRDLLDRLDGPAEVILVDDGSRDHSLQLMLDIHRVDSRFKVLELSRNFGHQIAISAGLDVAAGDAVIVMDGDLQDPPEVVLEMATKWREGYDVVHAVREQRLGETWAKRTMAAWFYRLHRRIANMDTPADAGDFRLVDRKALDAFRDMGERNRYVRGMFGWIGFHQTCIRYVRQERFAGRPAYSFWMSLRLAVDAMVSFSNMPLRLALSAGIAVSAFAAVYGLLALVARIEGHTVPGWTSLAVLTCFLGGIQLMVLGVMGEYLGRIYDEAKRRPLYIVRSQYGMIAARAERGCVPDEARCPVGHHHAA